MRDQTSELLRSATAEPSATPDFAKLWQQGRSRRRKIQMLSAASGLAVFGLVAVLAVTVLPGRQGTFVELGGAPNETAPPVRVVDDGVAVRPLAKMDGWSPSAAAAFQPTAPAFAVMEIVYDQSTAEKAWAAAVPDDLPNRDGQPEEVGLYGALDSVDFSQEAVVVWSSGQSGSCPGWLRDITTDGSTVELIDGRVGEFCTMDYNAYSMVLAVDRDRLPTSSELPTDDVVIDGRTTGMASLVDVYPTSGWPADGASEVGAAPDMTSGEGPAVRPLAKMDRWSRHFAEVWQAEHRAALEIAYDLPTAERAWVDLAVDALPRRSGKPRRPGRYAGLETVDFATEAVVVWSSGQSSTCPSWVADIATDGGRIAVTTQDTSDIHKPPARLKKGVVYGYDCTSDYNSYSMLLAVDRDRLPELSELPMDDFAVDGNATGGYVAEVYPISGEPGERATEE